MIKMRERILNTVYEDAVYKKVENRAMELDLYVPLKDIDKKNPVVVFFHGGYWKYGSRKDIPDKKYYDAVLKINEKGIIVVSADYRLLDENTGITEQVNDCVDCVKWLIDNADRFNIDTKNISLWGTSAGAHLAMLVAYSRNREIFTDSKMNFKSVISYYGPTDLNEMFFEGNKIRKFEGLAEEDMNGFFREFLGKNFDTCYRMLSESFKSKSPVEYFPENPIPTLLVHGKRDDVVPLLQSEKLFHIAEKNDNDIELFSSEFYGHGFSDISEDEMSSVVEKTVEFLGKVFNLN